MHWKEKVTEWFMTFQLAAKVNLFTALKYQDYLIILNKTFQVCPSLFEKL